MGGSPGRGEDAASRTFSREPVPTGLMVGRRQGTDEHLIRLATLSGPAIAVTAHAWPFQGEDKGAPGLDVISRQEDLSVAFSGGDREGARRVADLLATAMHLPDEERGSDPLMIEALDAHKERRGIEAARQPGRR